MSSFGPVELSVVLAAVTMDAVWGEVPNRVHPVVGMGRLTHWLLQKSPTKPTAQLLFGVGLVLVVVGTSVGAAGLACWLFSQTHALTSPYTVNPRQVFITSLCVGLEALLLSTLFALRGLLEAGTRMRRALGSSLAEGRAALGHLCSRSPASLDETALCAATVESLSENSSDSFVAPLFWYVLVALCGAPGLCGAAAYRAVNTLDAMVGYRGKYEYLGKAAARLDDALNWIPARLTAVLLVSSAALGARRFGFAPRQSLRVLRADHALTASPNAGWPMAAAAGALQVELTKSDQYTLGAGLAKPNVGTIGACQRLITWAGVLWLCGLMLCSWLTGEHG